MKEAKVFICFCYLKPQRLKIFNCILIGRKVDVTLAGQIKYLSAYCWFDLAVTRSILKLKRTKPFS